MHKQATETTIMNLVTPESFRNLVKHVTDFTQDKPLDKTLESELNHQFPTNGKTFTAIFETCRTAIAAGWMCAREAGGIKYGRVIKPADELWGFSVDIVDMNTVKGPHHRHPNGEIDMIMPLTDGAEFDNHGAGWLVYPADSAHHPTVTNGHAIILYLLPQGAIEFTR